MASLPNALRIMLSRASRAALAQAGVHPGDVSFVEAHGTGTALGDPIEMGAIKAVFAQGRHEEHPLVMGALKTNIGHLEGAAGIAGLIKLVLVLHNRQVPPNINFSELNHQIDIENFPVSFPTELLSLNHHRNESSSLIGGSKLSATGSITIVNYLAT